MNRMRRIANCFTVESHVIAEGKPISRLSEFGELFLCLMVVIFLAVWR